LYGIAARAKGSSKNKTARTIRTRERVGLGVQVGAGACRAGVGQTQFMACPRKS
jgi:hypothetical protein